MNKLLRGKHSSSPASRWRRQPIYAATRLRCALAMMILAFAVILSALPSLATHAPCTGESPAPSLLAAPACEHGAS